MKKQLMIMFLAGSFAFASCSKTEKTDSDTATVIDDDSALKEEAAKNYADTEAMYRDRAEKVTRRMANDMKFDNDQELQTNVQKAYVTRATRRDEVRNQFNNDTTGMYLELRKVDLETDQEFKRILQPAQYTVYERNRTTYMGGFDNPEMLEEEETATASGSSTGGRKNTSNMLGPGTTVKTKVEKDGDIKTEIEGPNGEIKIKRDADDGETKVKRNLND